MDPNEFEKSLGLESVEDGCRRHYRTLREDREYWKETVPKFLSGEKGWDPETMAMLLMSMMKVENSVQFAIEQIYHRETGRILDKYEADNPGLGDSTPGQ